MQKTLSLKLIGPVLFNALTLVGVAVSGQDWIRHQLLGDGALERLPQL